MYLRTIDDSSMSFIYPNSFQYKVTHLLS